MLPFVTRLLQLVQQTELNRTQQVSSKSRWLPALSSNCDSFESRSKTLSTFMRMISTTSSTWAWVCWNLLLDLSAHKYSHQRYSTHSRSTSSRATYKLVAAAAAALSAAALASAFDIPGSALFMPKHRHEIVITSNRYNALHLHVELRMVTVRFWISKNM